MRHVQLICVSLRLEAFGSGLWALGFGLWALAPSSNDLVPLHDELTGRDEALDANALAHEAIDFRIRKRMSCSSPQLELTIAGHEHSGFVLVLGSDVDPFPNDVAFQLHDSLAC
jgi:hypothetical protein